MIEIHTETGEKASQNNEISANSNDISNALEGTYNPYTCKLCWEGFDDTEELESHNKSC